VNSARTASRCPSARNEQQRLVDTRHTRELRSDRGVDAVRRDLDRSEMARAAERHLQSSPSGIRGRMRRASQPLQRASLQSAAVHCLQRRDVAVHGFHSHSRDRC